MHDAETVEVHGPEDIVAWCEAHGYGLEPDVVDALLGPAALAEERRRRRGVRLRVAAALAVLAMAVAIGIATTDTPHGRTLNGRTGPIHVP